MHGTKFTMNDRNQGKKGRAVTDVNLTSMVDVCLTLVIIFMVSYPLVMQSGINVSTPSMKKARTMTEETELKAEINLKEDYSIELNGQVIDPVLLSDSLRSLMNASKNKLVVVSAEANVLHDHVVAILDEAKQCGAEQLSIIKKKQEEQK
ncbi:MAG: biopolymer transporter ExbD [bacterium]|nr:MAG: biopolymer transporter ExbD [bacterium]